MDARAGLDAMKTRKKPCPYRQSNDYSAVVHFVEELRCRPEVCVSIPGVFIRDCIWSLLPAALWPWDRLML